MARTGTKRTIKVIESGTRRSSDPSPTPEAASSSEMASADPAPSAVGRRAWLCGSLTLLAGALPMTWSPQLGAEETPHGASNEQLRKKLDALVNWTKEHGGTLSVQITDLHSHKPLASASPHLALNPASNMKVVTAAAALELLGPQMRFRTGVYGHLKGRRIDQLTLRGNGDPSLTEADLWRLSNALSAMGLKEVGQLSVDQSRFDSQFVPPAFGQQPHEWAAFRAPISAIAVDRNTVTLNVMPEQSGSPARAWFQPSGVVKITGSIQSVKRGKGQNIQLELKPAKQGLTARLAGHIAENLGRQRFERRVDDPRLLPGLVLAHQLRQAGVSVGSVSLGGQAEKSRLTYVSSPPLSELLKELGKHSDNFTAEMLFKALAGTHVTETADAKDPGHVTAVPKTSQAGAETVKSWLKEVGALTPKTQILNGSGLFDANRLSAASLVTVLSRAYQSSTTRNEYLSHLAIGGVDGTLLSRFRKYRQTRAIRAKTGTLNKVIALSGYALRSDGRAPIVFSFLVNGIAGRHHALRTKIDEVVETLI